MAQAHFTRPENESPEYHVPAEDANTRTTVEDIVLQELFRDSRFETVDDDSDLLLEYQRKRKISFDISETSVDTSEKVQIGNSVKEQTLNFRAEKNFQIGNLVKEQTLNFRDEKNFLCTVCEKDIGGHSEEGKRTKWYNCCVCRYKSKRRAFLQRHIDIHRAQNICFICAREYTEGEPHYSENICNVCKVEFECKTFLDQHYALDHERHFETHCWVCGRHIEKHTNESGRTSTYVCCSCGYTCTVCNSKNHNNTHRPQLFCFRCKEEYPANEMDRHDKEFNCVVCKETFKCLTFLEDHFNENHEVLSSNCIFCPKLLNQHKKDGSFHCCVCSQNLGRKTLLQQHLLTHTRLRLFKCDVCGKRFSKKSFRKRHSNSCSQSLLKCEMCRGGFPSRNSLKVHCSEKHSDPKK